VLSKSFPENSIFAKVYIRQQYQTFFSNIRRKCKVQNQTYSFAKFNSAKTLFYVLSIAFPENSFFCKSLHSLVIQNFLQQHQKKLHSAKPEVFCAKSIFLPNSISRAEFKICRKILFPEKI